MKKLLALLPLPPPYSGPEISSKILFSKLIENPNVKVINMSIKKDKFKRGLITIDSIIKFTLIYLKYLFSLITFNPYFVYHCITATKIGWIRDLIILLPAIFLRKKVILHMRGGHFGIFFKELKSGTLKSLIKLCIKSSYKIIVQSESLKEQFTDIVSENKIEVLPNTFEEMFLNINPKREGNKILFLGLLTFAKGYNDLVKVAKEILSEFENVEFIFVGERMKTETNIFYNQLTKEKLKIEPYIELNHKNVKYIKNVYGEEKKRIYEVCDIFVLPSYSEGFSMAILEAMVSGLAVITTPVGANKDIIKNFENGILIEPGNLTQLKNSIILLLKDKNLREKLSKNARNFAINNFHPEIVRKKLERIFEN
ncbi:MAG: glycosyltransferase family 4 protein [candidate division WOR-3 bacterium]